MHKADPLLIASFVFFAIVVWLIGRALRQNAVFVRIAARAAPEGCLLPSLTVIIPARNESANISPCLRSLLAQQYPAQRLRFVVIDDDSQDDTAAIIASLARHDARVTLLHAPPLPVGWKGKVHACWYALQAMPADTEWLCFIDADVSAQPLALATAMQLAHAGARIFSAPGSWLSRLPGSARIAAGYELIYRIGKDYPKPEFGIQSVKVKGASVVQREG